MSKLGEEPWREPSRELKAAMQAGDREAVHRFKAHAGDQFVVDEHKATKAAEEMSKSLSELHLKAKLITLLAKADPLKVPPDLASKYKTMAETPTQISARLEPGASPLNDVPGLQAIRAANQPRPAGKPISMVSSKRLRPDEPMVPNRNQAGVVAGLKAAPPETHVLVDHLLEQGAQFTKPPAFEPGSAARAPAAAGGGRPGQPVTSADLGHVAALHPLSSANRQTMTQHPDLGAGDPMVAFEVPGPAMMGTPNAWKSPSNVRNSEYLDSSFWSAVGRMAGIKNNALHREGDEEGEVGKAEMPPGSPPAAPAGMAAPAKPALHTSVEGFMGGLKALPKGSPERGRFITAHMNHPPFLQALQAHPQGPQVHAQLTSFMNSRANAGPGGPMKVTAKKELSKAEPQFVPGMHVHDGDRNLVVLKVHPARHANDRHLYTLRDPVDNTLSHAFESRLGPSKEQK